MVAFRWKKFDRFVTITLSRMGGLIRGIIIYSKSIIGCLNANRIPFGSARQAIMDIHFSLSPFSTDTAVLPKTASKEPDD